MKKMMNKPMMKCGHAANATVNGKPACAICMCEEIAKTPDLTGRFAKCPFCGHETESNINLPFFEYRPNDEYDRYYDGCFGWD